MVFNIMQVIAVLSAVLAALATSTAAVHGPDFFLYLTGHFQHNAWVPEINAASPAAGLTALLLHSFALWFIASQTRAAMLAGVCTLTWAIAAAELCREYGKTNPGPAIWLGWGAILFGNWAIGLRPKRSSEL